MNEIKTLIDAGNAVSVPCVRLKQAISAFELALEALDADGHHACSFLRYPMYSDTLNLVLETMMGASDALQDGINAIFAAGGKQRESAREEQT